VTAKPEQSVPNTPAQVDSPVGMLRVEFLDRAGYRQRRFRDAASLLPVVAGVLMILPLMWPRDTPDQSLTSDGMIYLFCLWFGLILLAFGVSRVLRFSGGDTGLETGEAGADE